ncbi:dTMP kinase [Hoyosella sp. G463]|uniref:Thymidylate kinase n=1 Tax=Lolliginicoccus lacisalsi TaxID=2742202 RepID=A0A927PMP1_9ACTN|nr:dTMP kinase [Lolliginicoccus lacisalsi]MBD8506616.1 dTMP kinase [Lolliginicoccus lacisalsi]
MGMLVVLEGLDGSGKRTLAAALRQELADRGLRATSLAFPRYGQSQPADIAAEALRGQHGDLLASINGMAVLWALDRYGARPLLEQLRQEHDVVLLDRYVASNAAYSAARGEAGAEHATMEWVRELEHDRLALPEPALYILVDVEAAVAEQRARHREATEPGRGRDAYERDSTLQDRTATIYRQLAEQQWTSPWVVFRGSAGDGAIEALAGRIEDIRAAGDGRR